MVSGEWTRPGCGGRLYGGSVTPAGQLQMCDRSLPPLTARRLAGVSVRFDVMLMSAATLVNSLTYIREDNSGARRRAYAL